MKHKKSFEVMWQKKTYTGFAEVKARDKQDAKKVARKEYPISSNMKIFRNVKEVDARVKDAGDREHLHRIFKVKLSRANTASH